MTEYQNNAWGRINRLRDDIKWYRDVYNTMSASTMSDKTAVKWFNEYIATMQMFVEIDLSPEGQKYFKSLPFGDDNG